MPTGIIFECRSGALRGASTIGTILPAKHRMARSASCRARGRSPRRRHRHRRQAACASASPRCDRARVKHRSGTAPISTERIAVLPPCIPRMTRDNESGDSGQACGRLKSLGRVHEMDSERVRSTHRKRHIPTLSTSGPIYDPVKLDAGASGTRHENNNVISVILDRGRRERPNECPNLLSEARQRSRRQR